MVILLTTLNVTIVLGVQKYSVKTLYVMQIYAIIEYCCRYVAVIGML
jgi:hypothetical protein